MQRLFNFMMVSLMASGLLFMTSCGEDDPVAAAPDVYLTTSSASVFPKETVLIEGTASAEAGLSSLTVSVDGGTAESILTPTADTVDFSWEYVVPADQAAGDVTLTITATDDLGVTASADFTVTVKEATAVTAHTVVLLGGQLNATEPSFYNALTNETYMQADFTGAHTAHTDLLYFFGTTNEATLASPTDTDADNAFSGVLAATAGKNETLFKTSDLTAADFDGVEFVHEIDNYSFETGGLTKANHLAVGNVLVIKLDAGRGGKFGLIKVVEIAGTTGSNRTIKIEVKVQP